MQLSKSDLGKIVDLPVRPEWGPGIIRQVDHRFALVHFRNTGAKENKKYSLHENPLVWAANQDQPDLKKKVRSLRPKRRIKPPTPPALP